MSKLNMIFW